MGPEGDQGGHRMSPDRSGQMGVGPHADAQGMVTHHLDDPRIEVERVRPEGERAVEVLQAAQLPMGEAGPVEEEEVRIEFGHRPVEVEVPGLVQRDR